MGQDQDLRPVYSQNNPTNQTNAYIFAVMVVATSQIGDATSQQARDVIFGLQKATIVLD